MANGSVDDAMFCEACGAHRDQLGVAGEHMQPCPDCGRATCANCWNQVAGGCLSCRAFALPIAAAAATTKVRQKVPTGTAPSKVTAGTTAAVTATAAAKPKRADARFKRGSKPQPDAVVTSMPGVVETTSVAAVVAATVVSRPSVARFGHIRVGRVVRASAIGSALAVSVVTVVFAGVIRLAPAGGTASDGTTPSTTIPGVLSTDPGATPAPEGTASSGDPAATTIPGDPVVTPGSTDPGGGADPTHGGPGATDKPIVISTPKPTTGATATPTSAPTPTPTPEPTADPTPTPGATATPTPEPPTPEPPTPEPPTPEPPTPEP